mgnify:CR=1 FL=1
MFGQNVPMISFSILDLVPVTEGSDARRAFANMIELAPDSTRLKSVGGTPPGCATK